MINTLASERLSAARRNRTLAPVAASLEPRLCLNGVAFSPPVNTSAASTGISPVYIDLDAMGDADLVTSNSNNSVSILRNHGDGTFGAATTIPLDFTPLTIQLGVLTEGVGLPDIVVGSASSNVFGVIMQTYGAVFGSAQDYTTGLANTKSIVIGDFNGDGKPDIAIAADGGGTSNNVAIFLNNGSGLFTQSQVLSVPHGDLASITTYTAGSTTDLAVADSADNEVTTLLNNGSGTFTIGSDYSVGADPVAITYGWFDHSDNNEDLVTANAAGGSVSVLPGNGDGTFKSAVNSTLDGTSPGGGPLTVGLANLNSDFVNSSDLICLLSPGSSGDAETLLCNGDGTFQVANIISTGGGTRTGIGVGDLNGDGFTDVVLSNENEVTSLMNISNSRGLTAIMYGPQPSVTAGAPILEFAVTYQDAEDVDTSTLGNGNFTVTGPFGNTLAATLVSTDLIAGNDVTATYSIPAQSNSASPADDGVYTVIATSNSANAVKDVSGLALETGQIGQFTVTLPVDNQNVPNLVASRVTVNNPATGFTDARFTGVACVTIVNSGDAAADGEIVIDLYLSPTQYIPTGIQPLTSVTRSIDLEPGGKVVEALPGFYWPETVGRNYIVADVDATETMAETTYGDNFCTSSKSTNLVIPFVDIANLWPGKLPATLKVGRRTPLAVALKNLGNTVARNTATYTVQAEGSNGDLTTIGTGSVRVVAAAGGRTAVSIPVTVPSSLVSDTYHIVITISYPGDTDAGNDSAISSNTVTV